MPSPPLRCIAGPLLRGLSGVALASAAQAQIVMDGTLGAPGALTGPNFAITSSLGRQFGANLFHSFSTFNIASGQSATFSGPGSVSNIIGRVTGGSASNIDGVLRSTITGANLYLINPRGILFGPNASLDLTGSFHAASADYIKLGDGGRFDATNPAASVLTAAPPAAFGFLGPTAGPITVQGSQLAVPEGASISLVGGPVELADASVRTVAGDIRLVAMGGAGEVPVGATGPSLAGATLAPLAVTRSTLDTSSGAGTAPGRMVIRGGRITVLDSAIASTNLESPDAPPIEIAASENLLVRGSTMTTDSAGSGRGADLRMSGDNVTLDGFTQVTAQTRGPGRGGDIELSARQTVLVAAGPADPGFSYVYAPVYAGGDGGSIRLAADRIVVDAGIVASQTFAPGNGGAISMTGRDVDLVTGASVYSTSEGSGGRPGDMLVNASNRFTVSGADWTGYASNVLALNGGAQRGGDIRVDAREMVVSTGANITSGNYAAGRGGDILLRVGELRVLPDSEIKSFAYFYPGSTGRGGDIIVQRPAGSERGGNVTLSSGWLLTRAQGDGDGGDIRIDGDSLRVEGTDARDGLIHTEVGINATGRGGNVTLQVPSILFGAHSMLWLVTNGAGDGGNVLIRTRDIEARAASALFTDTAPWATGGNGGNFTIEGTGRLTMGANTVTPFPHWILSPDEVGIGAFSAGPGRTGDVTINIPDINGRAGSYIVAFAKNSGDAGSVAINAQRVSLSDKSVIQVWAVNDYGGRYANNAGSILLNIGESFEMTSGVASFTDQRFGQTVTYRGGIRMQSMTDGNAGSLVINAPRIVLDDVAVEASTWLAGRGGRIEINTNDLVLRNGARIDSKAMPGSSGAAGSILVDARDRIDISGISRFDGSFSGISAQTWGSGNGGDVRVRTGDFAVDRGFVKTSTGGAGNAGSIDIEARRVALTSGAAVDAGTAQGSTGAGGSIRVVALDSIRVSGIDRNPVIPIPAQPDRDPGWAEALGPGRAQGPVASAITSSTAGAGAGGNINVSAPRVAIEDGGRFSANSSGAGTAGSIFVQAPDWLKLNDGSISTEALASDGGNIDIRAGNLVYLKNSEITTSVGGGSGNGGNIFIDPTFVVLDNSRIAANAFGGAGGNISIIADYFITSPDSTVEASSQLGVSGSVQIAAPRTDPGSSLARLPAALFDASGLLRNSCAGRAGPGASSLMGVGRGGLAASPTGYSGSRYFADAGLPGANPTARLGGKPAGMTVPGSVLLASACGK